MKKLLGVMILAIAFFPVRVVAETAVARASSTVIANDGEVRIINKVEARAGTGSAVVKKEIFRARFEENLAKIKDETKQRLVERIGTQMCNINKNRTSTMMNQLNRMGQILEKVELRAASASARGKDVGAVKTAVERAKSRIAEAKTAVSNQANADCTINISGSTTGLSGEVGRAVSGLEQTLRGVNEKVKIARTAVSDAIRALAKVMGTPLPTKPVTVD